VRDRLVEVAIDAAGAGGSRLYTYLVPPELADLEDGEAVLVGFGRRQALGVILGPGAPVAGVTPRPIMDRVRADGPLLPPLALGLARWIAEHYLAPPALVVRAMLPPGLLERLELVAERLPGTCRPLAAGPAGRTWTRSHGRPGGRSRRPIRSRSISSSSWRPGRGR
jgi:primosomal protein N'